MRSLDSYRRALETGDFAAMLAREALDRPLLTDANRMASLHRALAESLTSTVW